MVKGESHVPKSESMILRTKKQKAQMNIAMVILTASFIIQSMMVTGSLKLCVGTIEKLYHYNSFQIAFIDICYNFGFAFGAFTLGSMMIKRKMRWIGCGMLLITTGCILFILPVFMIKQTENTKLDISYVCKSSEIHRKIQCKYGSYLYLFLMCFAYFLIGVGSAPLQTIAVNFIHENTIPQKAGLLVGIYYTCASLGPIFAFLTYSAIIRVPLMISKDPHNIMTYKDENWVGAFWIIYAAGSILALLLSVPLILYPTNSKITNTEGLFDLTSQTEKFVLLLQKIRINKEFLLMTMARVFDSMMSHTIGVFFVKFLAAKFSVPADKAAIYSGVIVVLGAAIGFFSGGLTLKLTNLSGKRLIRVISVISCAGIIASCFLFIRCPENPIKGVVYKNNTLEFVSKLATDCHCNIHEFLPVCGNKGKSYYSPCAVGCKNESQSNGSNIFTGCSKVFASTRTVKQGRCPRTCNLFVVFMITGFICLVMLFYIYTPQMTHSMSVLDEETAQLGLSIQQMLVRMSLMFGPLYQGKFFDMSCRIFSPAFRCTKTKNCIDYNINHLTLAIAVPALVLKSLATICLISADILYKPRKLSLEKLRSRASFHHQA